MYFCAGNRLVSVLLSLENDSPELRAESQQIAAWQLLYRVQHPARYQSRLQTNPSPDIELPEGSTQVKPRTRADTDVIDRAAHVGGTRPLARATAPPLGTAPPNKVTLF